MSGSGRLLPLLLRAVGVAALMGLVAGAAPWAGAATASRVGLVLLLAAPWLVVLHSAWRRSPEAPRRRPLAWMLLAAAAALVAVTLLGGGR